MLTFLTTAKPFLGHDGVIQRNALKSWTLLRPDVEVILFGDDAGAAAAARSLGVRHEPQVERNERGSKRLDNLLGRAQAIARHNLLCYINCDIILMQDFCKALARVNAAHSEFLMVGRRWDTEVNELYDFEKKDWETPLRTTVLQQAKQRTPRLDRLFCIHARALRAGHTTSGDWAGLLGQLASLEGAKFKLPSG